MNTNDGGPAFPTPKSVELGMANNGRIKTTPGMSLRDWFAGMALQGIASTAIIGKQLNGEPHTYLTIASECFKTADAMLAERSK